MNDRLSLREATPEEPLKLSLRPKEAAAAIGVSERTLLTLRNRGLIRGIRLGAAQGATVLYRVEELKRFLAEAEAATEADRQTDDGAGSPMEGAAE